MTAVEADGFRLDDGTAIGRIVLADAAAGVIELLQPGDALNATGVPERRDEVVLVVGDAADVELVGDLGDAGDDGVEPGPGPARERGRRTGTRSRASLGRGMGLDPASAGAGTLAPRRAPVRRGARSPAGTARSGPSGSGSSPGSRPSDTASAVPGPGDAGPPRREHGRSRHAPTSPRTAPGAAPNGARTRHARPTLGPCVRRTA